MDEIEDNRKLYVRKDLQGSKRHKHYEEPANKQCEIVTSVSTTQF
jgi:hypothetical protein